MSAEEQRRALDYVRAVRERFIDEPKRYERFLSIMKDFKSSRINASVVAARVRETLSAHDDLVAGFNVFLPEDARSDARGGLGATASSARRRGGAAKTPRGRGRPRGSTKAAAAAATVRGDDGDDDDRAVYDRREVRAEMTQANLNGGYALLHRIRSSYASDERPYQAFLQTLIKFRNKQFSAEEVVHKFALLFYDKPYLLEGKDGLESFVPKTCKPPRRSTWFDWKPSVHHRFSSESFRLFVRTLLMCEFKSRYNPPEPKTRRWRLSDERDSSESDSDDSTDSDSETESSTVVEKESGTLRADQIPDCWTGSKADRVLSAFEKLALELKPMDEEYCWADTKVKRESKVVKEEVESRGKRGRGEERDYTNTPRESPSPPPSFNKRRASARITAKVNRGIIYNRYRSLQSPDGALGGRMRMTRSMSTVDDELPPKLGKKLVLHRDAAKMSPLCAERIGLHSLPANCIEKIIAHFAAQEGSAELNVIRETLMKSLIKKGY